MIVFDTAYFLLCLHSWLFHRRAECRIAKDGDAMFRIELYEPEKNRMLDLLRSWFSNPGRELAHVEEVPPFVQVSFPTAESFGLYPPGWYCNRWN